MKLNVYVDAFNLYYGALKGTRCKWLDIRKHCELEFPNDTVHRIRYFTAKVKGRPDNPSQHLRQQIYLRALRTIPNLEIHEGHYLTSKIWMPLADPISGGPTKARVIKSEEKGSDVNIATYMILDAIRSDCDGLVLISNDSDLIEPVRIIVNELGMPVTVLHPCRPPRYPAGKLKQVASTSLNLTHRYLRISQFPPVVIDANGKEIRKPTMWWKKKR